jgi:hypothetical protein
VIAFPASVVKDKYLYIIGGSNSFRSGKVYRLDLTSPSGAWDDAGVADLPYPSDQMPAVLYNNSIFMLGGNTVFMSNSSTYRLRTNDIPSDVSQITSLGRTVSLKISRYGYDAGKPMRIVGSETDLANNKMSLFVWG